MVTYYNACVFCVGWTLPWQGEGGGGGGYANEDPPGNTVIKEILLTVRLLPATISRILLCGPVVIVGHERVAAEGKASKWPLRLG